MVVKVYKYYTYSTYSAFVGQGPLVNDAIFQGSLFCFVHRHSYNPHWMAELSDSLTYLPDYTKYIPKLIYSSSSSLPGLSANAVDPVPRHDGGEANVDVCLIRHQRGRVCDARGDDQHRDSHLRHGGPPLVDVGCSCGSGRRNSRERIRPWGHCGRQQRPHCRRPLNADADGRREDQAES